MSLHTKLSPTWRYALLGGLPVGPLATWGYVQSGSDIEFTGLGLLALAVGYLAKRRGLDATPVGFRAGLVAAVPVALWLVVDVGWSITEFHQPAFMTVAQGLMLLVFAGVTLVSGALWGMLTARIGGWLAERGGHPRDGAPA